MTLIRISKYLQFVYCNFISTRIFYEKLYENYNNYNWTLKAHDGSDQHHSQPALWKLQVPGTWYIEGTILSKSVTSWYSLRKFIKQRQRLQSTGCPKKGYSQNTAGATVHCTGSITSGLHALCLEIVFFGCISPKDCHFAGKIWSHNTQFA